MKMKWLKKLWPEEEVSPVEYSVTPLSQEFKEYSLTFSSRQPAREYRRALMKSKPQIRAIISQRRYDDMNEAPYISEERKIS